MSSSSIIQSRGHLNRGHKVGTANRFSELTEVRNAGSIPCRLFEFNNETIVSVPTRVVLEVIERALDEGEATGCVISVEQHRLRGSGVRFSWANERVCGIIIIP